VADACACARGTFVAASAPGSAPLVIVALGALSEWSAASLLSKLTTGPPRYPRAAGEGGSIACSEHRGRSVWLLRSAWRDLDADALARRHDRERTLRALACASFVMADLPEHDRLTRARHAADGHGDLPSRIDLIHRLRDTLRDVATDPPTLVPVAGELDDEERALLARVCGNHPTLTRVDTALDWILDGPAPRAKGVTFEPDAPVNSRSMSEPSRDVRVSIVDCGGDVGHRLLCGVHAATARARTSRADGAVTLKAPGARIAVEASSANVQIGQRVVAFGPPPPSGRPIPSWEATFDWGLGVQRATVEYGLDPAKADVIVAGIGGEAGLAAPIFVRVLERSWTANTPVVLLFDDWAGQPQAGGSDIVIRWAETGLSGAATWCLSAGREIDAVARALALVALPPPEPASEGSPIPGLDVEGWR
jgi:hypothetical protein